MEEITEWDGEKRKKNECPATHESNKRAKADKGEGETKEISETEQSLTKDMLVLLDTLPPSPAVARFRDEVHRFMRVRTEDSATSPFAHLLSSTIGTSQMRAVTAEELYDITSVFGIPHCHSVLTDDSSTAPLPLPEWSDELICKAIPRIWEVSGYVMRGSEEALTAFSKFHPKWCELVMTRPEIRKILDPQVQSSHP